MYEEGNKRLSLNWGSLLVKLVILAIIVLLACWVFIHINKNNNSSKLATTDNEYINNVSAMKTAAFEYYTAQNLPEKVGETEKLTLAQMINQKLLIDFTNDGKTCDANSSYVQTTKTSDGNYALKVSLNCGKKEDFIVTTIENKELNCPEITKCSIKETNEVKDNNATSTTNNNNSSNKVNNSTSSSSASSNNTASTASSNNVGTTNASNTTTKTITTTTTTTVKVNLSCFTCNNKQDDTNKDDKAVWPAIMYVVNFDLRGGKGAIASQDVTAGKTVNRPVNPSRDGYSFVEWQLNGKTYDFSSPVTGNITLTAIWKENAPVKTRYYEYVKYSDWTDGYLYGKNIENSYNNVTTYNYCKDSTKTYYSISYVGATTKNNYTYTYEYQMLDLDPNKIAEGTVGVISSSATYFNNNNLTDYNNYLNLKKSGNIYMTGDTSKISGFYSLTASDLRNSSLTSKNFTFSVSGVYLKDNVYMTKITINFKNGNGVTPYESPTNGSILRVPVKFDVSYSNLSDCIRDDASKKSYYSNRNYSISGPQTTQKWQHRTVTYTWSSNTSLSGYSKTGNYEDR